MAGVRLHRFEIREKLLPPVCMQCGDDATTESKKTFSWHPPWVIVLVLTVIPYIIVAVVLTKRMTIYAPFCEKHKNHWSWRSRFIWGGFGLFFILGIASMALLISQEDRGPRGESTLAGLLCGATVLCALIWLIVAAIVQNAGIRPTEITDRTITLTHISPHFVDALELERDKYDDEDDDYEVDRVPIRRR